jgi:HD-like signal output (HDOD) protein
MADESSAAIIAAKLTAHFSSPGYTPPLLPAVALDVHRLAQSADVDIGKLVGTLEKDPLLAARVVKIAQSAAFASVGNINSLKDAALRIGLRNVCDLAWEVAVSMRVFRAPRFEAAMEVVRRHSAACGQIARLVSSQTAIAPDYAFLCGLLHDIGFAACLILLGEQTDLAPGLDEAELGAALRTCHEEASRIVAALWKLPPEVQKVIGGHHTAVVDRWVHPPIAVVVVAEGLAEELGFGVSLGGKPQDGTNEAAFALAREALSLDDALLAKLRTGAQKLASNVDRASAPASAPPGPTRPAASRPRP